ncbi:MAG: C40 family peptidase [Sulfuricurvum sp.]|nr:C40 family peptidase [Sulfuricurvum sp.]
MSGRCLILSLLLLNNALLADTNQRREPSLFLEYEREVTRTIDPIQDEPNPFKRIMAPITPKVTLPRITTVESIKSLAVVERPDIGNDALPFLVINKPVTLENVVPLSCPDPVMRKDVIAEMEDNQKKSLFENIHSVKERVMARAKKLLGTPYGFGTDGVSQTDCSGFTQQVFSQFGISLPHSAVEQASYGKDVDKKDIQVGDLMFFHTYKNEPSHVAIYAGDGQIIHASYKNRRVQYDDIDKGYYKKRFMYAKRLALNNHDASNE